MAEIGTSASPTKPGRSASPRTYDGSVTTSLPRTLALTLLLALTAAPSCSDPPGEACDCGDGEFCCLDRCLPLGSVCGGVDGAVDEHDAEVTADAAGLDAGGDAGPGCQLSCNPGYWCVGWTAPESGAYTEYCVDEGRSPCDPAEPPRCEGNTRIECQPQQREDAPPGLTLANDCAQLIGPDSTCREADGGAECSGTPCDADAFVSRCEGDGFLWCDPARGLVRLQPCFDDQYTCREVALEGCAGPTCIPRVAIEAGDATCERVGLSCDGEALRLQQFGWEWSEQCFAPALERCFELTADDGGPQCLSRDTVLCDPDAYAAECIDDAMAERTCEHHSDPGPWVVTETACGAIGGLPSACDEQTGRCYPTQPCYLPEFYPQCSPDGRFLIQCIDEQEIAEPCACGGAVAEASCQ